MDGWHFPRTDLAEQYLTHLKLGISSSLAIIAPRRKGKTLFILQDLAPLAGKHQYIPVYASLWQNIDAPHEGIILALQEAIDTLLRKTSFKGLLGAKIKSASVSNELLGKLEVEFSDDPVKPSPQALLRLDKLLTTLEQLAGKKKVLLLIDEVQHLATSKSFDPLTHALRTMLDKRQGRAKMICTGSSRHYMQLLLNESQSPFYHFVEMVPFPELGGDFVGFLRNKLVNEYGISVALPALKKAFAELDESPYWMMKMMANMVTFKTSVKQAQAHIVDLMEAAEGYERTVKKLKPIDTIIFLALCNDENPYAKEILQRIEKETTVKGIAPNVQRAIKRLIDQHLISRIQKGEYCIEKPGLQRYLL